MPSSFLAGHFKCIIVMILIAIIASVGTWAVMSYASPGPTGPAPAPREYKKAAWIYVGPIGDYGWTHAHDLGRRYVDDLFPWLETHYVEAVKEGDCPMVIDSLVAEGYTIIFTTSFGFMDATIEAGERYPDIIFFHCSGYKRRANVGTYFAEFYQLYYLNGLMAGALTQTGKAGYVAAHPIPEVIRHINAFAIGFAEVAQQRYERGELPNPPEVHVRWIHEWYDPAKARQAAEALIGEGCDVLAFTEDSPTVIEVCQEYYERGQPIYSFAHYSPMYDYGPDVVVSGQLVHWEVIYQDIITKIALGVYTPYNLENVDYWWMLHEGAVELGCDFGMPINPKFEEPLKAVEVVDRVSGEEVSVYDLVFIRLEQMRREPPHVQVADEDGNIVWLTPDVEFDPFMGPLYDQEGALRVAEGDRLGHDDLWEMMWFVQWVVGTIPA